MTTTETAITPAALEIEAVVFDVVGTLVDEVGTVTDETRRVLGTHDHAHGHEHGQAGELARDWLERFDAAVGRVARGEQPWAPDPVLRARLLDELLAEHELRLATQERDQLASVGHRLRPWPRAAEQVAALAELTTVTALTNASTDQILEISRRGRLRWHTVLSTAPARTYKPAPAAYRLLTEQLGLTPHRTLFIATHPWDLRAAAEHGFRTAYLPRPGADRPTQDDRFDLALDTLDQLNNPGHWPSTT